MTLTDDLRDIIRPPFIPRVEPVSFGREVMAVAVTRIENTWIGYIGPNNVAETLARGRKLPEKVARAIFDYSPFDGMKYADPY